MFDVSLVAQLEKWAVDAGIEPNAFECKFYDQCVRSGAKLDSGNTVVMSYLGQRYGHPLGGSRLRLMIIGMDHGRPDSLTVKARHEQISSYKEPGSDPFNPHYRGVVRTAAAFLGKHGVRCVEACTSLCTSSESLIAADMCVLDRIVQPNLVKCVGTDVTNMTCKSTTTMRSNCSHHLFAEIGLLAPDIVVVHGVKEQRHILGHMTMQGIEHSDLGSRIGVPQVLYAVPGLSCHFVFLWHPARNMMARIWDKRAVPALAHLTAVGVIPST